MRTIETTQAIIAHPNEPTIIFLSRAKLRCAPTEDQGGFMRYAPFTSSDATNGSSSRNYLLHDSMESSTLVMLRGVLAAAMQWYNYDYHMITDMTTDIIGLSTGAEFEILEQWSQIVWHLRKGSTITPNVLKWLADTIRDYYCRLSYFAPDRTTESDRCERAICANSILLRQKSTKPDQSQTREDGCVPIRWHTKRVFRIAVEMTFIRSLDSQDPWGYRMDRLGTLRRPADSTCV